MSTSERTFSNGNGNGTAGLAPPQNLEAEQSVLGAVLLSDATLPALIIDEKLNPADFYRPGHGTIYESMLALHSHGEPVDALTLVEHLKQNGELDNVGGRAAIDLLAAAVPSVGNVRQYAKIVRDNAMLRRLLHASFEIQQRVHAHDAPPRELVDLAERAILEVAHDDRRKDFQSIHDVLSAELEKLEMLSRHGTSMTGTPSGFEDLDTLTGGFQPGNLIVLAARPSMGKCLAGGSLVLDPTTGLRRRIDALVADVEAGKAATVASVDADLRLRRSPVGAAMRSGVQRVYALTTALGRRVEATANHPLLTLDGWRELRELEPGSRIAVPRRLPAAASPVPLPDHELVLLAALVAEPRLVREDPEACFDEGSVVLDELERAFEVASLDDPGGTIRARLARQHGTGGPTQRIPDAVHALPPAQIARFLSILYACDGTAQVGSRSGRIDLFAGDEGLARDVVHLLLRLGIVAELRPLGRSGHEVRIACRAPLEAFAAAVPIAGMSTTLALAGGDGGPDVRSPRPGGPRRIRAVASPRPWVELAAAPTPSRLGATRWEVDPRGVPDALLAEVAAARARAEREGPSSDLQWDHVDRIEPLGEQETYDLTVPGDHNFLADDVVVHNSALMANFAEHAALEDGKPVALFSLEMSEGELAQRFIASQSSTKGDDLRKGRVRESQWGKILAASNRLASSPLFIDDSSELSVLDVRAKARRLAQQQASGLGLIVIDYLQLMRADGASDNRVEQIGQISRGLKTLARELEVPVIALSQLNRSVEQRHDKRPVLSDLRDSGAIEQDADLVMFIYREEYYEQDSEREGIADLIISKHRNGGLGTIELTFQKEYPRFMSYVGPDRYDL